MQIPAILSIVFGAACATCIFIGIYVLYLNPHNRPNILLFTLAIALSIWAFGFSMAINAKNVALALFWRRFSAFGWGSFFSMLLRFCIVLTSEKNHVHKKWRIALTYLPSLVVFLGFTYFSLNPEQYNLVWTHFGWINVAAYNSWSIYYILHYTIYIFYSFYLIRRWGKTSGTLKDKKLSALMQSVIITFFIVSFADAFNNIIFTQIIPQLAPIFMTLPMCNIYISIKKYGLLNPRHIDGNPALVTDDIQIKLANYLSITLLFTAILNIIATYILTEFQSLSRVLMFSGFLILCGAALQVIQRCIKATSTKNLLNAIVLSIIIPAMNIQFIEYASPTVWAFSFVLLIIGLIYGKSFIQTILYVVIFLTQIVTWLVTPEITLTITYSDHIVRLCILILGVWFANFAGKIFRSKLDENAEQINLQNITVNISSDFITANAKNIDDKIDKMLSEVGVCLGLDRIFIFLDHEKKNSMTCRNVWCKPKTQSKKSDAIIESSNYPRFTSLINAGKSILISDTSDKGCETGKEVSLLLGENNKSFAAVPIIIKNDVYGFVGLEAEQKPKKWPESHISLIRIISNILSDTFERIQQENEISNMAFYDYLTKLPNRILFMDRAAQAIKLTERTNKKIAVVFLDLDAFKAVNDTLGHDAGDELIVKTAEKLSKIMRKSDTVSRFGGDEFLILLNNMKSINDIPKIIDRILAIFDKPFTINGHECFVSASAGIAVYPRDGIEPAELIKNADLAMYKAKENDKSRYKLCTEDMKNELNLKIELTNSLIKALERHEFTVHYQPKVNTGSKKIIGVEALLRWNNPQYGMIPPATFIPLAEQSGIIGPIGDWVLMEACRQCRTWHLSGMPDMRIAVNVSVLQLRNPGFVERVKQILSRFELEPQYLELEITESAAINESEHIYENLSKFKKLGVSISIDDFGTEYSSLSRLSTMPIDRVKLAMEFVHGIGKDEKENSIIKGIIRLAHTIGLGVIAEGVETLQQLEFLTECSSDEIQGFYYYHPLPPQELESILKAQYL